MKVLWAVICEGSATDQESNNISLFNIVEEMHIPAPPESEEESNAPPLFAARLQLVALFSRSDFERSERKKARLVIRLPNGRSVITEPPLEVDLESAHRSRIRLNLPGIPTGGEGQCIFELQGQDEDAEWGPISEVPIHVSYLT